MFIFSNQCVKKANRSSETQNQPKKLGRKYLVAISLENIYDEYFERFCHH